MTDFTDTDWLQWRREGITATEVADAACDTYGGMYAVLARKLGLYEVEQNEQMDRGHRWQDPIANIVEAAFDCIVTDDEAMAEHEHDPRWRATLDGLACDPIGHRGDVADLEVKTVGVGARPNRERWYMQMQWQLFVTGLQKALLAEARIDDDVDECVGLRFEWVLADPPTQALLVDLAEEMWEHLQAGTLPEPTGVALDAVRAVHAVAVPSKSPVPLQAHEEALVRRDRLREEVLERELAIALIEARLIEALGEDTKGTTDGGWRVSRSEPARVLTAQAEAELLEAHPEFGKRVLDRDRVKAEAPELYDAARTRTGSRTLRITPPKDNR